jgi:alpha-L-fucosidase
MDTNGEAIYGTSPWKVFRDGPTTATKAPIEIRFTAKGNSLYAICMAWPAKEVTIRTLAPPGLAGRKIAGVRMLGSTDEVRWQQTTDGLVLSVPQTKPGQFAFVYRIDFNPE